MESNLHINYIIFTILYITSVFFSYKENTQSLSILALFVVNTSFLMYLSKDIVYYMSNKGISPSILQYGITFSILGSLFINSAALFLQNLSLMTLRTKNIENGDSTTNMNKKNTMLFDDFRTSQTIFISLLGIVLGSFLYYYENISFNMVEIINNGGNWYNLISVFIVIGGMTLLSHTSSTFANSKEFSKVRL
tara:strand:+ start:295 stop:873 length:579 start_codon:yes stop_codon:yes gene_type:complete